MTRVVAVRHGGTDWYRNAGTQGWAPTDLHDAGREQADEFSARLVDEYDVGRAVVLDLLDARRTASLVFLLTHVGDVPVDQDADCRGWDLGVYQGLTYGDVEERVGGPRPATKWLQVIVE